MNSSMPWARWTTTRVTKTEHPCRDRRLRDERAARPRCPQPPSRTRGASGTTSRPRQDSERRTPAATGQTTLHLTSASHRSPGSNSGPTAAPPPTCSLRPTSRSPGPRTPPPPLPRAEARRSSPPKDSQHPESDRTSLCLASREATASPPSTLKSQPLDPEGLPSSKTFLQQLRTGPLQANVLGVVTAQLAFTIWLSVEENRLLA